MHELSLCENVREVIEEHALAHGLVRVTRVRLEIGRFSCVEKPALAFAFESVMRRSVADGAVLEIIDVPGHALCLDCGEDVELDARFASCPICVSDKLVQKGGDEMRVRNLEGV